MGKLRRSLRRGFAVCTGFEKRATGGSQCCCCTHVATYATAFGRRFFRHTLTAPGQGQPRAARPPGPSPVPRTPHLKPNHPPTPPLGHHSTLPWAGSCGGHRGPGLRGRGRRGSGGGCQCYAPQHGTINRGLAELGCHQALKPYW